MSGAWWFLIGWFSAASFIGIGTLIQHRQRQARKAWIDAQDSEQFASGCERFTSAQGI